MNSFKPLITIAVLCGIGYVVYNQLNSKTPPPPPGAPTNWDNTANVQMPGEGGSSSKWGGLGGSSNSLLPQAGLGGNASSTASRGNTANTAAPPFAAPPSFNGSQVPPRVEAANYNDSRTPATPENRAIAPADDKWGTTDPAAAVTGNAPVATANYGDQPLTGTSPPIADRYSAAPTDSNPPATPLQRDSQLPVNSNDVVKQFQSAWENGNKLLEEGKLTEGLVELSKWHEHPQLSATENQQLTDLLDQVAGTVIYSTQHQLEPAHVVKPNERLEDIGQQYNVPWQLIAKINGIDDPATLQPGEQLKVVRGPFSAVIQVEQRQLTLMLNGMYAGRFALGIGRDMPPHVGTFEVTEKVINPVYHGRERTIDANDPNNPLGGRWIAIGSDMGLHGTGPLTDISSTNQPGSISLGARDIDDVFDILSVGSKVIVMK